jgi:hypothetical protein
LSARVRNAARVASPSRCSSAWPRWRSRCRNRSKATPGSQRQKTSTNGPGSGASSSTTVSAYQKLSRTAPSRSCAIRTIAASAARLRVLENSQPKPHGGKERLLDRVLRDQTKFKRVRQRLRDTRLPRRSEAAHDDTQARRPHAAESALPRADVGKWYGPGLLGGIPRVTFAHAGPGQQSDRLDIDPGARLR